MRGSLPWFILAAVVLAAGVLFLSDGQPVAGLSGDQFASLIYVGIWGSVLAAGLVVAFRGRWGQAAKGAAIWVFAFALLIGLYAFGSEFRMIGDRMLAVLVPGRAIEVAGSDGRQVMVVRAGDDHFHLDAEVNGTNVPFLVDTGASVVAIDRDVAERIGIDTSRLVYGSRIQTANGVASAASVVLDSLRIGDIERRDVAAVVTEGDGIGISLLGMSFLGTLSSFEFRGDRLVLSD